MYFAACPMCFCTAALVTFSRRWPIDESPLLGFLQPLLSLGSRCSPARYPIDNGDQEHIGQYVGRLDIAPARTMMLFSGPRSSMARNEWTTPAKSFNCSVQLDIGVAACCCIRGDAASPKCLRPYPSVSILVLDPRAIPKPMG